MHHIKKNTEKLEHLCAQKSNLNDEGSGNQTQWQMSERAGYS